MNKTLLGIVAIASLVVTPALAADLSFKEPPSPAPTWSWTGFYIGVQGGAGWGTTTFNETSWNFCAPTLCAVPPPGVPAVGSISSYGISGWHGGGTLGFNWQYGPVVFGVEGDISGSNINGNGDCSFAMSANMLVLGAQTGCQTNMTWFGTLTGRVGIAVDHALIYVKGGGAEAHFNYTTTASAPLVSVGPVVTLGENRFGGTVGIGIEYALWNNWSAKLEYDYIDFGSRNLSFLGTPCVTTLNTCVDNESVRETVSVVRAGVNYRFSWK